ncbi:MAG TPA: ABC transporter permease [Nocardioidaceae bacterium]|nr:ABC transporter permease [Nocardioidaceae bacterium]
MLADTWSFLLDGGNWSGPQGMGAYLVQQLLLTVTAVCAAAVVGLPVASWLGHIGRGGALAINISNVGRAVPTFAVLGILSLGPLGIDELWLYGRAGLATLVSLLLFALPPIVTNTYVGLREVDRDIVDAARGMGMRGPQLFRRVELPLALPLIVTGLRLAVVQVWATATIAALVAGPGLGNVVTEGFATSDTAQVIGGALVIALVAVVLEVAMAVAERAAAPIPGGAAGRAPRPETPSATAEPVQPA